MSEHDGGHVKSPVQDVTALRRLAGSIADSWIAHVRGLQRLVGILAGWKARNSQEVATHLLLLIGFYIEWLVLQRVVVDQALHDANSTLEYAMPVLAFGSSLVILCLLFHQFAIFRNFSLPRDAEERRHGLDVDQTVLASIVRLESGDSEATLGLLKAVPRPPEMRVNPEVWKARTLKGFEIAIFAAFGVLTGEAGYMLTVLHEHDPNHWTARFMFDLFGTSGWGWGRTLECAFLLCATLICLLVLVWDGIVASSPVARARYGDSLWTFALNDFLSFVFWACLFVINTPRVRFELGERFVPTSEMGAGIQYAWMILGLCSLLYVLVVGGRIRSGVKALAEEPSYLDARFREI